MFNEGWTAPDAPDQTGRTVVVTGANSGLGFEATRALADRGATVVLACRRPERGEAAATDIRETVPDADLDVRECNLASLDSIRDFADACLDDYEEIHALCNNAGVMALPYRQTAEGFEYQLGVNHLGHFALTGLLLDRLEATEGRVVTQSSGMHERGDVDPEYLARTDGALDPETYDRWDAYGRSKLANVLFAYELDRRSDVTSVACHPGYTATNLQTRAAEERGSQVALYGMRLANALFGQSAERGALPLLYGATAPDVEGGRYYGPDGLLSMRGYPEEQRSSDRSYDQRLARRLWEVSADLTGVAYAMEGAESEAKGGAEDENGTDAADE